MSRLEIVNVFQHPSHHEIGGPSLAGASLQYVQRMMRHHSIGRTLAYAHLCPEDNSAGIDFKGRRGVLLGGLLPGLRGAAVLGREGARSATRGRSYYTPDYTNGSLRRLKRPGPHGVILNSLGPGHFNISAQNPRAGE
jgi:hypothetical protein